MFTLLPRDDDSCKNSNSSECEKPVQDNAKIIAISVCVPVFVIFLILGYLLYRNYRKEKKEMLEDPDFDETGDLTALPDTNPFQDKKMIHHQSYQANNMRQANYSADPYIVLPYTHQIGSKVSLDEYSKRLVYSRDSTYTESKTYGYNRQNASLKDNQSNLESYEMQEKNVNTVVSPVKEEFKETKTDDIESSHSHGIDEIESYDTEESEVIAKNVQSDNEDEFHDTLEHDTTMGHDDSNRTLIKSPFEQEVAPPTFTVEDTENDEFTFSDDNNDVTATTTREQDIKKTKSPRISQFDLLNNESDNEEEHEKLTKEQEEEIKRMKSVYKVYFDKDGNDVPLSSYNKFAPDMSQPVPSLEIAEPVQKINKDLNADTDYSKRMTTASSIYTSNQLNDGDQEVYYNDPNQRYDQYYQPDQNQQYYQQDPNQQYYQPGYDQNQQYYQQQYPQEPQVVTRANLPPLQQLGSASELRKSSLQTFTDYLPSKKNGQIVSPTNKNFPSDPINNQWQSPTLSSQSQFDGNGSQISAPDAKGANPPSASQMARTSVVMLNPVTEITKLRKFKPAGSLPRSNTNPQQLHAFYNNEDLNDSENDLIPGNRKSQVRRMMNTNF